MARDARPQIAGGLYHVNTRGNRRCEIFSDDDDRVSFLQVFARVVRRANWTCHAYCLMTTHYHLLVETPTPTISAGMEVLNGQFARSFNQRYGLRGHLFEERFHHELVEDDVHLLETSRYIVLNPVRAGICSRAEEWRWSSFRATVGAVPAPPFLAVDALLRMFGRDSRSAVRRYADFVEDGAV